jgi:subtilisin family serine protease
MPVLFHFFLSRTRRVVNVDLVQDFNVTTGVAQGLGGQGVDIGIFDSGVNQGHNDFTGRAPVTQNAVSAHGTHVAGIALGDGRMSNQNDSWGNLNGGTAFQWRAMSPQSNLIEAAANYLAYVSTNGMDGV